MFSQVLGSDLIWVISSAELSSTSLPSNPPTPPSKTTEALKLALKSVKSELNTLKVQWEGDREQLLGQKAVLQDAANRLNMDLEAKKSEAEQALQSGRQHASLETVSEANIVILLSHWSSRSLGRPKVLWTILKMP